MHLRQLRVVPHKACLRWEGVQLNRCSSKINTGLVLAAVSDTQEVPLADQISCCWGWNLMSDDSFRSNVLQNLQQTCQQEIQPASQSVMRECSPSCKNGVWHKWIMAIRRKTTTPLQGEKRTLHMKEAAISSHQQPPVSCSLWFPVCSGSTGTSLPLWRTAGCTAHPRWPPGPPPAWRPSWPPASLCYGSHPRCSNKGGHRWWPEGKLTPEQVHGTLIKPSQGGALKSMRFTSVISTFHPSSSSNMLRAFLIASWPCRTKNSWSSLSGAGFTSSGFGSAKDSFFNHLSSTNDVRKPTEFGVFF